MFFCALTYGVNIALDLMFFRSLGMSANYPKSPVHSHLDQITLDCTLLVGRDIRCHTQAMVGVDIRFHTQAMVGVGATTSVGVVGGASTILPAHHYTAAVLFLQQICAV